MYHVVIEERALLRKKPILYVRWGKGKALGLGLSGGELEIVSANTRILLHPRDIVIEAQVEKYEDVIAGKRKYLYVYFRNTIEPLDAPRIDISDVEVVDGFEVRATNIEFARYLTIITPGAYLYNYVIISDNVLTAEVNTRREIYYEQITKGVTIYFL